MNYLPTEIHEKILLEAEPKTLLDACYTNKEALKMCSTDGFWERYYKKHKMEFKPWNYDIGGRIKTARMNLMRLMTVAELRKECNSDKQAQAICESNKFWENYRNVYLREGSSKQKLKSAEMDELLSKSKNIKNSKIYAKITDLAAFKKIILYVDKAKLSDDHKNRIYDFLKNTDHIYVGITQPGRGSFHYNLYDKNKMNIFIFASTYSTFWEIFDIMKNIKVEGKPYFTTEYSTEVNIREEIDFVVHSIDAFEKEGVVDFGSNQIFLNTTNIEFYSDHHELLIDIIYLPLVKDVLEKYKNFITTFR